MNIVNFKRSADPHGWAAWNCKPGTAFDIRNSSSSALCLLSCPYRLSCPNPSCRQSVIMQNEPNCQRTKMNLTFYSEITYENTTLSCTPKNEPKTYPAPTGRTIRRMGFSPSNQTAASHACPESAKADVGSDERRFCKTNPIANRISL